MKYRTDTGEIVEATLIHSRGEAHVTWQTWQVPDGRVFQAYSDRWPAWVDEDGVLPHTACSLKDPNDKDVRRWAGNTYVSPSDQEYMDQMARNVDRIQERQ